MDFLEFIASLVDSLAWPVFLGLVLWFSRDYLLELLPQLTRIKYKDFEAEFSRDLERIKETSDYQQIEASPLAERETELLSLAELAPNAAVLEAWREVERTAKQLLNREGHAPDYAIGAPYRLMERLLEKTQLLPQKDIKVFRELRTLRNKVAHAENYDISAGQAAEYVKLAMFLAGRMAGASKK
jgi:hypothetical protein